MHTVMCIVMRTVMRAAGLAYRYGMGGLMCSQGAVVGVAVGTKELPQLSGLHRADMRRTACGWTCFTSP